MLQLIVGLGNPGKKYEKSKHNVGFMCLDTYAKISHLKFTKEGKFQAEITQKNQTILLKPKTFMNLSGNAVKLVADYYKIPSENILIISDDVDLPLAKIRLRETGGSGGHNGLKSIISQLGTENFKRCRIGIDRDDSVETKEHVLSLFSKAEMKAMVDLQLTTSQLIEDFVLEQSFDVLMNKYNIK
ncbi:MAG: aminoacyl-tRNA hydrolase [Firmicutes bacterium]|nr:aminoacyl-tRNA hydrolase [Bacillota bacterium]